MFLFSAEKNPFGCANSGDGGDGTDIDVDRSFTATATGGCVPTDNGGSRGGGGSSTAGSAKKQSGCDGRTTPGMELLGEI